MDNNYELVNKFLEYVNKFKWWNGAEFGTIVGLFATLFDKGSIAWIICLIAFVLESIIAYRHMKKADKILAELYANKGI